MHMKKPDMLFELPFVSSVTSWWDRLQKCSPDYLPHTVRGVNGSSLTPQHLHSAYLCFQSHKNYEPDQGWI